MQRSSSNNLLTVTLVAIVITISSCDDIITMQSPSSQPVLNIDAWLTNKPGAQSIYLTWSQPYFDNTQLPSGVSGASVSVADNAGNSYDFIENTSANNGLYQWTPPVDSVFGKVGSTYILTVQYQGETFTASCKMGRVPPVDSITFSQDERTRGKSTTIMYSAQFWGTDPKGAGDTYWIKSYKNGILLDKPSEIDLAYDAATTKSDQFDGLQFTLPVRSRINADDTDANGDRISPLSPGDSIYVEINSLSEASFNYLNQVIIQTNRNGGISELFTSVPLANVGSNISNTNGSSGSPVVGFFNVASVSGLGKRFQE